MRILVVGSDGRAHALVEAISQSPVVSLVFALPGNAGTSHRAQNVALDPNDFEALTRFAKQHGIDLAVISSEDLLVRGVADALRTQGIPVFGPNKRAALFEGSKGFTQQMMQDEGVSVLPFIMFDDHDTACDYALGELKRGSEAAVIKADGLARGQGVFVCRMPEDVFHAMRLLKKDRVFGTAGDRVMMQRYASGFELSSHAICDEKTLMMFPFFVQDFKRLREDATGDPRPNPNTGSMGAYGPVPLAHLNRLDLSVSWVRQYIVEPSWQGMERLCRPYTGCMYHGLMATADAVYPLEGNCRFGHPELIIFLMMMKRDIVTFLLGCAMGDLGLCGELEWHSGAAMTVTLAHRHYPYGSDEGTVIEGVEDAERIPGVRVFHGSTAYLDGHLVTHGTGRSLHVSAYAERGTIQASIAEARRLIFNEAIPRIGFPGVQYRRDIALGLPA